MNIFPGPVLKKIWINKSAPPGIILPATITATIMALPLIYILLRAFSGNAASWASLFNTRIPTLIINTLGLTLAVTGLAATISVILSWLIERSDMPGRHIFRLILALPMAIPPYIGAFCYITVLGHKGLLQQLIDSALKTPAQQVSVPSIYGFAGVTLVLTLFTYPYIFLLVSAALRSINPNLEEAASISGLKPIQVFLQVTLPLLRPSISAGSILVAMYVLSDFGTISLLRFNTFSSAIYLQLIGRYDRSAAAILSVVLIAITSLVIFYDYSNKDKNSGKYYQISNAQRPASTVPLSRWRLPAFFFVSIISLLSVILPVSLLLFWSFNGIYDGAIDSRFLEYSLNSLLSSGAAAIATFIAAMPVAYLSVRYRGLFSKSLSMIANAGYALPGVVVALGVLFIFNRHLHWMYGTSAMMITAYVIRFLPQALQAQEASLSQLSPNLDEAASGFGYPLWKIIWKIIIPLTKPGILAGASLVFLSSMKELPATLLLRPAGFDTLAVRIWIEASEGFYELAAPSALLLILISLLPLKALLKKNT